MSTWFDGRDYEMIRGDAIPTMADMPAESMDLAVFSPPFASLFAYSGEIADIGNNHEEDGEFKLHMAFFATALFRIMKPGRLVCCHCAQVAHQKRASGREGVKDLRGMMIRLAERAGFWYTGEAAIWKNPQAQAIRTKAKALLFARLETDHLNSRPALADYVLLFKKPGDSAIPVTSDLTDGGLRQQEREAWIKWASPFWTDIRETEVLNYREARGEDDTKHICPLQLEVIRRCVRLWSNPGEIVFSPFAGIGSEGHVALLEGRRFVGVELKPEYHEAADRNLAKAERKRDEDTQPLLADVGAR